MQSLDFIKFLYSEDQFLAYTKKGNGKKIILFLHGMGASSKSWHYFQHNFSPEEYTLYLIDLKGYGYSSKPFDNRYSIADQAEIITSLLKHLDLDNVIILGHSLGGGVALYTYIMANRIEGNNRISKMILINTMAFRNEMPMLYYLIANPFTMRFIYTFSTAGFKSKYTLLRACRNRKAVTKDMIERYAYFLKGKPMKYVLMKTAQQLIWKDYEETIAAYRAVKIPVLIIRGKKDPILPIKHGHQLHDMIPHSSMVVINHAGHVTHEEQTTLTYEAIDKWLDLQY